MTFEVFWSIEVGEQVGLDVPTICGSSENLSEEQN